MSSLSATSITSADGYVFDSTFIAVFGHPATAAHNIAIVRYSTIACLCWLVYDALLTLEEEVDKIWTGKWSVVKTVFVLNRYCGMTAMIFNTIVFLSHMFTNNFCESWLIFEGCAGLCIFAMIEVILIIRIIGLYDRNRCILLGLSGIFVAQMATMTIVLGKGLPMLQPISRPGPWFTGCLPASFPNLLWGFWIPASCFEVLALSVAAFRSIRTYSLRPHNYSLLVALYMDSIHYMAVVAGCTIACTLVWTTVTPSLTSFGIAPTIAVSSSLGCRIILNMPSLQWPPDRSNLSEPDIELSLHFAKNPALEDEDDISVVLTLGKDDPESSPGGTLPDSKQVDTHSAAEITSRGDIDVLSYHHGDLRMTSEETREIARTDSLSITPTLFSPVVNEQEDTIPTSRSPTAPQHLHNDDDDAPGPSITRWTRSVDEARTPNAEDWNPFAIGDTDLVDLDNDDEDYYNDRPRRTHRRRWNSEDLSVTPSNPYAHLGLPPMKTIRHPAPVAVSPAAYPRTSSRSRGLSRFAQRLHSSPLPAPLPPSDISLVHPSTAFPRQPVAASRSRISLLLHRNRSDSSTVRPSSPEEAETSPAFNPEAAETDRWTPLTRTPSRFSSHSRSNSGRFRRLITSSSPTPSLRHGASNWNQRSSGQFSRRRESDTATIDTVSTDWPMFSVDPRTIADTPDLA